MEPEKFVVELSEKIAKSSLYTSKGEELEGVAKELGIKIKKIGGCRFGEGKGDTIQRRASV